MMQAGGKRKRKRRHIDNKLLPENGNTAILPGIKGANCFF